MKIKFISNVSELAYFPGDVAELPAELVAPYIASGHIIVIPETEGTSNPLPAGLPMRDKLFAAGFSSLETIAAADLSIIEGISKTNALKIKTYVADFAK